MFSVKRCLTALTFGKMYGFDGKIDFKINSLHPGASRSAFCMTSRVTILGVALDMIYEFFFYELRIIFQLLNSYSYIFKIAIISALFQKLRRIDAFSKDFIQIFHLFHVILVACQI